MALVRPTLHQHAALGVRTVDLNPGPGRNREGGRLQATAQLGAEEVERARRWRRTWTAFAANWPAGATVRTPSLVICSVRVFGRNEGWDKPYISLRIGRLLINVEDAQALSDLTYVVREANLNADRAFGPAQHKPRPRRRA